MGSDIDFMSRWLIFFLGFLGISDVEVVAADGIMGADGRDKIVRTHEKVAELVG